MDKFKCVCPCMLGVEGLVAKELKKLGAEDVEAQNGRVLFKGNSYCNALKRKRKCIMKTTD